MSLNGIDLSFNDAYLPIYNLPKDACFVIRQTELNKLFNWLAGKNHPRIFTHIIPLSRLFWLACRNNETISPLIMQPYKLLSIFEQWASEEGITDRFSGDTLRLHLRGSPLPYQHKSKMMPFAMKTRIKDWIFRNTGSSTFSTPRLCVVVLSPG
jgi:hypothetical protein